jgi:hypothetical protein
MINGMLGRAAANDIRSSDEVIEFAGYACPYCISFRIQFDETGSILNR